MKRQLMRVPLSETIEPQEDRPIDREPTTAREEIIRRYERQQEELLGSPPHDVDGGPKEVEASAEDYESNLPPDPEKKDSRDDAPTAEPEPPARVDPQSSYSSAPQPIAYQHQPVMQPQLYPLALPDGRVTYVTGDQLQQFAHIGAATAMRQHEPAVTAQEPARQESRPIIDQDRAKEIARKIAYGTEDDGAQALLELTSSLTPQVDVDAIKRQAVQEALTVYQSNRDLDTVAQEFPMVAQNHRLGQMAALALHEIRSDPRSAAFPPVELYREACRRAMSVVQSVAGMVQPQPEVTGTTPATQAAPTASPQRLERKRAAPSTVSGTDRRLEDVEAQPMSEEEYRKSGFRDIQNARKQAPV